MGSNKNEPQDMRFFFGKKKFKLFFICSWNGGYRPVSLLIISGCLHCVCLTIVAHTYTDPDTVHVMHVCLSGNSHEDTLSLAPGASDSQMPAELTCVYAWCSDHCFSDVYGRFFSWVLSQHSSWSTFLQSPWGPAYRICVSHFSFVTVIRLPLFVFKLE